MTTKFFVQILMASLALAACGSINSSNKDAAALPSQNGATEPQGPGETLATHVQNSALAGTPEWAYKAFRSLFDSEANANQCVTNLGKSSEGRECSTCLSGNFNTGGGTAAACAAPACGLTIDALKSKIQEACKGVQSL